MKQKAIPLKLTMEYWLGVILHQERDFVEF